MSKPDDKNETPADIANSIYNELKTAKATHLSIGDMLDHATQIAEEAREYWSGVNPRSFQNNPTGRTALAGLHSFRQQVSDYVHNLDGVRLSAQVVNSSAAAYGTLTATAYHLVSPVQNFDPEHIYKTIDRPGQNEAHARKFERFNPELGRLYRQILQLQSRTTSYPEKSLLSDVRQAFDCLMDKLVSDGEVRAQPGWKPVDPKKPQMVTRQQRFEYAARKHVVDNTLRTALLAQSKHAVAVHDQLSSLYHQRNPIDIAKARAVCQDMLALLNLWADALGLRE